MANSTFPFISLKYIPSHFAEGTIGVARREFEATGSDVANFETGIPPIYSIPVKQGGKLVERGDINGIGWLATNLQVFFQNGGVITFNASHAATIGGYEKGAVLANYTEDDGLSFVMSTKDENSDNFVTDKSKVGDGKSWKQISPTLKDLSLKFDKANVDIDSKGLSASSDANVPSSKLVSSKLDLKIDKSSIEANSIASPSSTDKVPSSKAVSTALDEKIDKANIDSSSLSSDNSHVPSSSLVSTELALKFDKASVEKTAITASSEDKVPSSKAVSSALDDKFDKANVDTASLSSDDSRVPSSKLVIDKLSEKVDSSSIEKDSIASPASADKVPSSKAVSAAIDAINARIEPTSDYKFKGSKASESELPKSGNTANDVWVTMDDGSYWAYVSRKWTKIEATMGLLMKHVISLQNEVIALQGTP